MPFDFSGALAMVPSPDHRTARNFFNSISNCSLTTFSNSSSPPSWVNSSRRTRSENTKVTVVVVNREEEEPLFSVFCLCERNDDAIDVLLFFGIQLRTEPREAATPFWNLQRKRSKESIIGFLRRGRTPILSRPPRPQSLLQLFPREVLPAR
jgi:hypothetical protein